MDTKSLKEEDVKPLKAHPGYVYLKCTLDPCPKILGHPVRVYDLDKAVINVVQNDL
ncbi:hypothetical protein CEXT_733271, partial [Caerostris extrusa]